jgi:predicted ferric reductase
LAGAGVARAGSQRVQENRGQNVLYTIAVVLIVLWLLGLFAFHVGSLIHILLVIAVIVVLLRVIQGRKVL